MTQWNEMSELAKDEINTFDIHSKDAVDLKYRRSMEDHIKADIESLENLIGEELSEDDLRYLAEFNPDIFWNILRKIFDFLVYVSRLPVDWHDLVTSIKDIDEFQDRMVEIHRKANGGQVAPWVDATQKIYKFGRKLHDQFKPKPKNPWEKAWEDIVKNGITIEIKDGHHGPDLSPLLPLPNLQNLQYI